MRASIQKLYRDERGISFIYVAFGFMAFLSAAALSVDVGMFMTARSQTQNAADAGALAGAVALVQNSYTDRSATGPAVQGAINTAKANAVVGGEPTVAEGDVTFPIGPTGLDNRVQVIAHRPGVWTFFGRLFGVNTVDLNAIAVAEASQANAVTCVKPFTIPDKWREMGDPPWTPSSTFDIYDSKGRPLKTPDVYIGPDDKANYTGYNADRDKGLEIVLKASNNTNITASWYNPWDLPGHVGAADYRADIDGCNTTHVPIPYDATPENGNMVGPTKQGTQDLVDQDPDAHWDDKCACVQGSKFTRSPRVVAIPVYDPVVFADGQQHGKNISLKFVNIIGFFIEPMRGGEVVGRITPIAGLLDKNAGPAPAGAFPYVIRLVQ